LEYLQKEEKREVLWRKEKNKGRIGVGLSRKRRKTPVKVLARLLMMGGH